MGKGGSWTTPPLQENSSKYLIVKLGPNHMEVNFRCLQYFQIPMSHVPCLMSNVKSPMSSWNWRSWQFPVYWSLTLKQLHLVSIDFIYKFSVFCPPLSSGYVRKLPLYEKKTVIDHQYFMKSITSQRLIKIITIYDIPCKIKAQYSILPCQAIILSFSTVRNFLIMMIS